MALKIIQNPDKEYADTVKHKLKDNNGYCPCQLAKTEDTKCRCKAFREQIAQGIEGECHCGLWIATKQ